MSQCGSSRVPAAFVLTHRKRAESYAVTVFDEIARHVCQGSARIESVIKVNLSEMDIEKMIAELRAERQQVEQAILVLERIALGQGKRRGRPPKWMTPVKRRGRHWGARTSQGDGV